MSNRTMTIIFITALRICTVAFGQTTIKSSSDRINTINTAVNFITIHPNPSINGEIISVPDGTPGPGIYSNMGILAFDSAKIKATVDYFPRWKTEVNLIGIGGCYRLNKNNIIGSNLRYFSLGTTVFKDSIGNITSCIYPKEVALNFFYSYNIDNLTGIGVGIKYIYSDLTGGTFIDGIETHPGMAFAVDLGFAKQLPCKNGKWDHFLGVFLNNVGNKISYRQNSIKDFLPTTLTVGYGIRAYLSENQNMTLSYEWSKLLVPTPPEYYNSADSSDSNGGPVIKAGYNPNVGVFRGMIQSFYDAPLGFREELNEISHSFGAVYNNSLFSIGIGYFSEHFTKGNRKFLTIGASRIFIIGLTGLKMAISLSYQVPVYRNYSIGQIIKSGTNLFRLGINFSV